MTYKGYGRVVKGVGGLFTVRMFDGHSRLHVEPYVSMPLDGLTVHARGRGVLHRKGALLVGDLVEVTYDDGSFSVTDGVVCPAEDAAGIAIDRVCERSCALIRPPMANLDVLFVTLAAATPDPILETVDKLISIAEFNNIEPIIVIGKSELDRGAADSISQIYKKAGFTVFNVSVFENEGIEELSDFIKANLNGKTAAFAGASGVGKSSLMNKLFPHLTLDTGEISQKIERGKNTTRHVELFMHECDGGVGYIADTPGFSMLDFAHFDFFKKEDLPLTMREFDDYIGLCKYTKCSHTKEDGCAILEAVKRGDIAKSRHESFAQMYEVLKNKTDWKN